MGLRCSAARACRAPQASSFRKAEARGLGPVVPVAIAPSPPPLRLLRHLAAACVCRHRMSPQEPAVDVPPSGERQRSCS